MNVKFVDLKKEDKKASKNILKRIKNVLSQSQFVSGSEVELFENAFAKYIGAKYCVGLASGTDAILLSLKALGIGNNDEVIVPAMTFIGSVAPIVFLGAKPVLVDIDPKTHAIDVEKTKKAITKKTKAIIAVNLY